MSNAMTNQQGQAGTEMPSGISDLGCQAHDLKGLLNAIVNQISEADRRQSDTLHQMQDRLSNLGNDARTLRSRVPGQFQVAFERIETGMAELASRIAEVQSQTPEPSAFAAAYSQQAVDTFAPHTHAEDAADPYLSHSAVVTHAAPEAAHASEAPMALRFAQHAPSSTRQQKPQAFDTFDVIESLPGDVADPWDRDAANALASVYDAEPRTFHEDPYAAQITEAPHGYTPAGAAAAAASAAPVIDHGWLEKRFTEISERIEASLADISPDQSFFAIGQRIDQFERNFAVAFDNVATRNDVEAVRLIEAHMVELVEHLENTQNHLARIDVIEDQLSAIAQRLNEVHAIAASASEADLDGASAQHAVPQIDVAAVARAAAHEAASEVAARVAAQPQIHAPIAGLEDVRRLMEQSMSNSRQSEENTSALFDTLQQAMIRLLDRMDAIELNQHQVPQFVAPMAPAAAAPHRANAFDAPEYDSAPHREEPQFSYPPHDRGHDALDDAVAAVATKTAAPAQRPAHAQPSETAEAAPRNAPQPADARSSEKLRQDFIADARRAKMRLSGEDADAIVLPSLGTREVAPPAAAGKPAAAAKGKPTVSAAALPADGKAASVISPRVVALSVALALAGAAYVMLPSGKIANAPQAPMAASEQPEAAAGSETRVTQKAPAGKTPAGAGASAAPPPEADFSKPPVPAPGSPTQLNMHRTDGQIVPGDMTVGAAARPLHGISVANSEQASLEQVARAQRDQAMASVSNRLGEAAADNPAAVAPVALDMSNAQSAPAGVMPPKSTSSALDMPPATVGPLSLRLAAANGDASAEFEVGARLAEGKGTDQNFKDAAKWYQRSASQGFAQAQYRLGTLYERGLGVKADEGRAKEWYLRAAEQGNMKAMHNLAVLSANAKSGSPDYATAAKWFSDAADRGLADSQFNLAVLYENGLGVDTNMREAYKWLALAARGGDKEATRRRDIMKGKLPAAELAEAEALVRAFHVRQSDLMVNDARTAGEAWKKNPANGEAG